jgi:hypothetical protein
MPVLKERNISPKPGRGYSSGQYYTVKITEVTRRRGQNKAERRVLRRELIEKGIKAD